ncbi:PHP domain-containing protein [Anaerosolibacter sp.]|uniref:PHP domain-containing protein n=1 Tax=Anaerosolibacter sp. TaxID=1872527 RepID=UPI0039EFBC17
MKIAIDFHIHTALSPCGDEDMTPNNIIGMSVLKGLDAIAITDHNTIENCDACMTVGLKHNLIVIPGMELQTKEEVHLLCLFKNLSAAKEFQSKVYEKMSIKENLSELFGKQIIYDDKDQPVGENRRMLISSVNMSLEEAFRDVDLLEGVVIPAHVDKSSYSIIANLGFIPPNLPISIIEISKNGNHGALMEKFHFLQRYKSLRNSDAHYLHDILERESFIEVEEKSIFGILEALKAGNIIGGS